MFICNIFMLFQLFLYIKSQEQNVYNIQQCISSVMFNYSILNYYYYFYYYY